MGTTERCLDILLGVPLSRGLPILSPLRAPKVFVEALDKCFENVCELDIIFHSDKVRTGPPGTCSELAIDNTMGVTTGALHATSALSPR